MAVNIGPKIGIEGEAEYRKQINNIIQQSKTLASEMKALTTSFDKNGKSMEQNAKQHKLLQEQIKNQKSKLSELNRMLEESKAKFGENSTQTQKWQQAVNEAQADLNKLENELKELPSSLDIVTAKMATMGEKLETIGNKIASVGSRLTATVTTGIVGAFTAAVKTTGDFDAAMSKVQAVSGATASQMELLTAKAREMGETTKFSASESAEALNYMAMAGWKTDQMLNGLSGIMNLAAASGEDLGTTSDIVTDALTAFNMTADESGRFADILAAAASNANTNVAMMGESFKYVAPVAGAMGYSAEDVAVALGLMANAGIKADMAGTSLRNMMQRMAKPTKESQAAMDRLGISLQDSEGNMLSFRQIMDTLRDSMVDINMSLEDYNFQLDLLDTGLANGSITQKKYDAALEELNKQAFGAEGAEQARAAAMLGGTRAMAGLLAISNASIDDYEKLTAAIDDSSQAFAKLADGSVVPLNEALANGQEVIEQYNGSAEAMAAVMLDNLPGQITLLKSALEGFAISIGNILMPKIRELVKRAQELLDTFNALSDDEKMQIIKIAGIAAAVGPVLLIVGKLTAAIGSIMKMAPVISGALKAVGVAVGGISAPVLAVVAAIGVLVATFATLWKNNEEFRNGMRATWNGMKESFNGFISAIQERMPAIQEAFDNIISVVKPLWEAYCKMLAPTFQAAFDTIKLILDALFNAIVSVIDMITGLLTGNKELFMQGLTTFLTTIWTAITTWWTIFWTWVLTTINVVLSFFGTSVEQIKTLITTFLIELGAKIVEKATEIVDFVTEKITEICDFIASLPEKFYNWGVEMMQNLIDGIKSMISEVAAIVEEVASTVADFLHFSEPDKGPLSHFNDWMPDMMKQMAEQIEGGRYQVQVAAGHVAADIAAPMAGARTVTLNNNFSFQGGYTEADGRSIVRQINRQLGALYI
jgi:TP901 family phage tail tape measure protein